MPIRSLGEIPLPARQEILFIVSDIVSENKQSGDFLMIVTDSPPDASE
jgi:hypothetical protein